MAYETICLPATEQVYRTPSGIRPHRCLWAVTVDVVTAQLSRDSRYDHEEAEEERV